MDQNLQRGHVLLEYPQLSVVVLPKMNCAVVSGELYYTFVREAQFTYPFTVATSFLKYEATPGAAEPHFDRTRDTCGVKCMDLVFPGW